MKTLLVRLSSMGDLIHTLPAVDDLSRMRPDVELYWLCEAAFADIARLHPFVKEVHVMRWRQWRKQLKQKATWQEIGRLKSSLHHNRFDFVLDSQGLLKSALFAKTANAPIKGLDFNSARECWAALLYNQTFAVPKGKNAVWRNRALFASAFGYEMPAEQHFGLVVPEAGRLKDLPSHYYVALHATSRDSKLWPIEHWLALSEKLHGRDGAVVYLPWGNDTEKQRAENIAGKLPFVRVCEKMSLLQAAYLLDNAKGVIGVDTGLLHLANALDKPVVGIYTDTDPLQTGVQVSAWAKNLGNIGKIPSTDDVYHAVLQCMSAKANSAD
ncbi:lipopolysaccharide heptosyltransferase I [Neisseria animaloris]|uniref:lipopolysaccharide heptosyltransferase I n=1 Tax=Neisseria animaloris TaxID=326522 RepID=UPI000A195008|nr:lipopolysaccharide heptosyltransferase I [Neisseria animaloris]OSI07887.1 lipopolysaccharide heptosyltransferase I [Neisseria animaloris]VEH87686.1 lipopolysaccharide heptosyltransferase I [Neisseria animaloris]